MTTSIEDLPAFGESRIKQARDARRASSQRTRARRRQAHAERHGWVTLDEAVGLLGINAGNVRRWADKHGVRRDPNRGFYDADAVRAESERRRAARAKTGA